MRFSTAIVATVLAFGASALAGSLPSPMSQLIARHERDLALEARGEMTEFEARAYLIARAPPNGDCSTASPSRLGAIDCHHAGGHGWMYLGRCYSHQQMLLQGNQFKGSCYF